MNKKLLAFILASIPLSAGAEQPKIKVPDETIENMTREELKDLIREVLDEHSLEIKGGEIVPAEPYPVLSITPVYSFTPDHAILEEENGQRLNMKEKE